MSAARESRRRGGLGSPWLLGLLWVGAPSASGCAGPKPADSGAVVGDDPGGPQGGGEGSAGTGGAEEPGVVQAGDWTVVELVVSSDACGVSPVLESAPLSVTAVSPQGWDLELPLPDAPLRLRCVWDGTFWAAGPADDSLPGGTVRTVELGGTRESEAALEGRLFFSAACPAGSCGDETPAPCAAALDLRLEHGTR